MTKNPINRLNEELVQKSVILGNRLKPSEIDVTVFSVRPIRKGIVGPTLMVEELGLRKLNDGDFYVLQFYNRLDATKKGEFDCGTAGEVQKWIEDFDHAKQQAENDLVKAAGSKINFNMEAEINLDGHRPRVRHYASELKKLIKFGQGVRIFQDVSDSKNGKGVLVKFVATVDASADTIFEVVLNLDRHQRYEWDMLTGDLELVDSYDGHYDILYGTYGPKYLTRWQSNRDFVFSRKWFHGQDGTYSKRM